MKFGLAFDDALVPEWRDKYVDYAEGKKLIKAALAAMPLPLGSFLGPQPPTRRLSIFHGYSMRESNRVSPDQAFRDWLYSLLHMVDEFYISKEREVYERFLLLQDQLYLLRDHSIALRRERSAHNGIVDPDIAFQWLHRLELPSLPSFAVLRDCFKKSLPLAPEPEIRLDSFEDSPDTENQIRNGKATFSDLISAKDDCPSHSPDGLDVVSKIRGGTLASLQDPDTSDAGVDTAHTLTPHRRGNVIDPDMKSTKSAPDVEILDTKKGESSSGTHGAISPEIHRVQLPDGRIGPTTKDEEILLIKGGGTLSTTPTKHPDHDIDPLKCPDLFRPRHALSGTTSESRALSGTMSESHALSGTTSESHAHSGTTSESHRPPSGQSRFSGEHHIPDTPRDDGFPPPLASSRDHGDSHHASALDSDTMMDPITTTQDNAVPLRSSAPDHGKNFPNHPPSPKTGTLDHEIDPLATSQDSIVPIQPAMEDSNHPLASAHEAHLHLPPATMPSCQDLSLFPVLSPPRVEPTADQPQLGPPLTTGHAQSEAHSRRSPFSDQKDSQSPNVDSADSASLYTEWGPQSLDLPRRNLSPVYSDPSGPATEPTAAQKKQASRRDYATKQRSFNIPYVYARKQLKVALLEHYRALTLLRSYRALNRTALRKISKKFDKATLSNISTPFMAYVDNLAHMQTSDMVDKLVSHVEDIFIAFFDPDTNDRKHSLERLKSIAYAIGTSELRRPTFHSQVYVSGFGAGMALPLFVLAIYLALARTLNGSLVEGKYILQIWGGFFLLNLMVFLFAINLAVFDLFKINYKFIFEFDMASALDWRQFLVFPSLAFTLLALVMWFGINDFWPHRFAGRDWPWIYFAVVLVVFLWPGRNMYASSRAWLQIALWRLMWSGFYPVEFRDFFLGDILCSLTYTMGNILYFFCVYSHLWHGVYQGACGSSQSRLLGALSTLPSIWRFLQCMRRFLDTGDAFPHLANMLKFAISILYYALLSVYRIRRSSSNRAAFIAFAAINSVYSAIWDVLMDWSLFQPNSPHKFLRPHLFYGRPVYYYVAIVLDVILRFPWVFYACFSHQIQQSAATSFFVAVAEIIRRFVWIFFRMENEHCTNVVLFRASKDSPLPYPISARVERAIKKLVALKYGADPALERGDEINSPSAAQHHAEEDPVPIPPVFDPCSKAPSHVSARALGVLRPLISSEIGDLELARAQTLRSTTSRRRSSLALFGESIQRAHVKDFQRRTPTASSLQDADLSDEEDDILSDEPSSTNALQNRLPSVKEGP